MKRSWKTIISFAIVLCMMIAGSVTTVYGASTTADGASASKILKSASSVAKDENALKVKYASKWSHKSKDLKKRRVNIDKLAKESKKNRRAICSDYISYVLQDAGYLSKKNNFIVDHNSNIVKFKYNSKNQCYGWAKSDSLKKSLKKDFKFVTKYNGKKLKSVKSKIKKGSIVCMKEKNKLSSVHMMIKAGSSTFWNGGSATIGKDGYIHPKKGKFTKYNTWKITLILEPKAD